MGHSVPPGDSELTSRGPRLIGELISYQNGGKGWLVIPNEIEQTVSEHASSHHCYRQARWSGRAAYSSGCQKSGT